MPNISPLTLSNAYRGANYVDVYDFTTFSGNSNTYSDIKTFSFITTVKLLNFSSQTADDLVVLGNGATSNASGFSFAIIHDPLAYHNGLHTNYGVIISNGTTTTTLWLDRPIPKNVLVSIAVRYQRKGGTNNNTLSLTVIYQEGNRLVTNQTILTNAVLMQQSSTFALRSRRIAAGYNNTLYRLYYMSLFYYWVGMVKLEELFFTNTQVQISQYPMTFDRAVPNISLSMPFDRSGFTLLNFGNMLFWWNATDQADGTLTTFSDSSPNGRTITQNTTARKPTIEAATGGKRLSAIATRFMNTPGGGLESVLRNNTSGFTLLFAGGASRAGTDITLLNIGTVSQTQINVRVGSVAVDPDSGVTCYGLAVISSSNVTYNTSAILDPNVNHVIMVTVDFPNQVMKVFVNGAEVADGFVPAAGISNVDATTVSLFTNNATGIQGRAYHVGIYGEVMSLDNIYNVNNYIVAQHGADFPITNWESSAFTYPGTAVQLGSTPAWSNLPGLSDDLHSSNYASIVLSASQSSVANKLACTNYGFWGGGSGITGVEVNIRVPESGANVVGQTINCQLTLDGVTGVGDLKSLAWNTWGSVSNVRFMKIGGVTDSWGVSLSPSDVASSTFGVLIHIVNNTTAKTVTFDYVKMNVYNIDVVQ